MRKPSAFLLVPALLALGVSGCKKAPKDNSPVVASVGTEKITENAFAEALRAIAPTEALAKDILTNQTMLSKRNDFLDQLTKAKALVKFAKLQGLDKDASVQLRLEQMAAQVYLQTLLERRTTKLEPTADDLKAFYDKLVNQRKAEGKAEGLPALEQVKPQLAALWKQEQQKTVFDAILQEASQKSPITIADGYKSAPLVQQPK